MLALTIQCGAALFCLWCELLAGCCSTAFDVVLMKQVQPLVCNGHSQWILSSVTGLRQERSYCHSMPTHAAAVDESGDHIRHLRTVKCAVHKVCASLCLMILSRHMVCMGSSLPITSSVWVMMAGGSTASACYLYTSSSWHLSCCGCVKDSICVLLEPSTAFIRVAALFDPTRAFVTRHVLASR